MQKLYDSVKIIVYYTSRKIHDVLALKKLDKKQFKKNNHLSPVNLQFQFRNYKNSEEIYQYCDY